jgi:putative hydrolase of the HAD superfamily
MMEAIFFDYGGVIVHPSQKHAYRLERKYGLPEGALWRALYESPEWQALQLGGATEADWIEAASRELDVIGAPGPEILKEESTIWRDLDETMLDLVHRLRQRYRVGMISNAKPWLEAELRDVHKIDHLFEVVVNSASVGMRKPDPRIFRHAARILDLTPTVCVHIDDVMENIRGAEETGFHAIHYQGHLPSLVSELQRLGLRW